MTTEVLRNMIYARSPALDDLGLVVLDEVHFLQDAYRGPVWEEVIIHLPAPIRLVCLSATVSNADELATWIETVRGPTSVVVETRRPVRLDDHYLVGDRTNDQLYFLPTFVGGFPNPDAAKIDAQAVRRGRYGQRPARGSGQRVLYTPGRLETIELLAARAPAPGDLLHLQSQPVRGGGPPGRRRRDAADRRRAARGDPRDPRRAARRTRRDRSRRARRTTSSPPSSTPASHRTTPGWCRRSRKAVEQCFIAGLLGAVFATETLAVGVNMPARTVVIEKLTKFTGDHHELLTPGEYTQLTGRAGRRGIDEVGQAVVLWSPFVAFDRVAALASSRSFNLRSAFRPTYNMAANLVRTYTSEQAHHLLNLSFAQYQADRDVVRLEARAERLRSSVAEARAEAESSYGDIWEYRAEHAAERSVDGRSERESALGPAASRRRRAGQPRPLPRTGGDGGERVAQGRDAPDRDLRGRRVVARHRRRRDRAGRAARQGAPAGHVPAEGPPVPPGGRQAARPRRRCARERRTGRRAAARHGIHPVELDPDLRQRVRAAAQAERLRARARRDRHAGSTATTARSVASSTVSSACSSTAATSIAPARRLVVDRQGDDARQRVPRV